MERNSRTRLWTADEFLIRFERSTSNLLISFSIDLVDEIATCTVSVNKKLNQTVTSISELRYSNHFGPKANEANTASPDVLKSNIVPAAEPFQKSPIPETLHHWI